MDSFPPNSKGPEARATEPKKIERVTSASAVRRKKSLGRQFGQTFFGGDAKTALQYMVASVLIPAAKEAIVEAASSGFEKLVYGDAGGRRGRGPTASAMGTTARVAYNRMGQAAQPAPQQQGRLPRSTRARQNFDEIVIPDRREAEEVLERMFDIIGKYETVTVADLYELTGLNVTHTDHKWGWTSLRGAQVGRARGGGYVLDLPAPGHFD